MSSVSAFRFAGAPRHARRSMAWYASMFGDGPVLDIGAGRGYFLEALAARGVEGVGVDTSDESVAEARRAGLEIEHEDAFTFLERRSDAGGIFLSHLIEHFEPARAAVLLRLSVAAVRPGGTLVIVTPNPRDWLIMSDIFWLDPTHVRPYPIALLGAMLEAEGCRVEASGLRPLQLGRRHIPSTFMNRLRFGSEYGRGEAWIRARRAS